MSEQGVGGEACQESLGLAMGYLFFGALGWNGVGFVVRLMS